MKGPKKPNNNENKTKPRNHKEGEWEPTYYSSFLLALGCWLKMTLIQPHTLILNFPFIEYFAPAPKQFSRESGMQPLFVLLPSWLPFSLEMSSWSLTT